MPYFFNVTVMHVSYFWLERKGECDEYDGEGNGGLGADWH